jgi:hypothetical protein
MYAVEGVFGDGRALAVRSEVARRRIDDRRLQGVWHLPQTGYKVFTRYREHGAQALSDRCRRPVRYANQLPAQIESLIVTLKRETPHWGARKIRELLVRRLNGDLRIPAKSTIHAVLHRHGLVKAMRRPHQRPSGTPLSAGVAPNELWCADFKGEFKLGNGLTVIR